MGSEEGPNGERVAHHGGRLTLGLTAVAVAMLPLLRPGGPGNVAPVDLLLGAALLAFPLWASVSRHKLRFPYAVGMGVLIVGGAVGAIAGPVPVTSGVALLQDVWLLAWCWAVVNLASSPGRFKVLLATWAYSATAWAAALVIGLIAGWTWITGQTDSEASRTALTLGDPSYAGSYFFISIMLIWASGFPRHRATRLVAYTLLVIALFSTGSNSGIISLLVGVSVAFVASIWRRSGLVPAVSAGCLLLIGGVLLVSNISIERIQQTAHDSPYGFVRDGIGRSDVSASQRDMLLHQSIDLYKEGGPLGQGPVSTKSRLQQNMAPFIKEAHDDYLAALIERGMVGVLGLVILLSSVAARTLPALRARLTGGFDAVVPNRHALLGALAGTVVAMSVYELLHVRHVWTLFALLAAFALWGRE